MAKGMCAQNIVTLTAEALVETAQKATQNSPAPVHLWDPPFCGDLDMRVARDGTWFYQGTPINREGMVKLFSSILKKEDKGFFLVTPVEKVGITVDDVPFVAVDFSVRNAGPKQEIVFSTNVGDETIAGPDAPIRVTFDARSGEPSPYVMVRNGLEALIDRKSFYRLVDICETKRHDGADWFGVRSRDAFFPIIPSDELAQD